MVGFYLRFLDDFIKMKSILENGSLGDVELISWESIGGGPFSHRFPPSPVPEWWFDPIKVGGGALLDTGSHMIDLLRWLLDDDFTLQYVNFEYKFNLPMEDTAVVILKNKNKNTTSILTSGWFAHKSTINMDIYGTSDSISLKDIKSNRSIKRIAWQMSKNILRKCISKKIEPYSICEISTGVGYYRELKHFISCIMEDKRPLVNGEDGLECAKIIDDAYNMFSHTR